VLCALHRTGARCGKVRCALLCMLRRTGLRRTELRRTGLRRTGLRRTGLRRTGLLRTGLRRTGLRRTGLRHTGLRRTELRRTEVRHVLLQSGACRATHRIGCELRVGECQRWPTTARGICHLPATIDHAD
jgi:hypothetical protein